jgi:hypothetical protein
MVLPVIPAISGGIYTVAKVLGGTYNPWTAAVDAFVLVLKAQLNTSDSIVSADLFTQASPTATPVFVATYSVNVAGTSSSADLALGELVLTWRTDDGGLLRMYIMECVISNNYRQSRATAGSTIQALFDFVTASSGFVFGRGGGVPIAPIFATGKINDVLRKKFLLNS